MRRTPINARTVQPRLGHERFALDQFGIDSPNDQIREMEGRLAGLRNGGDPPRITGNHSDGSALASLVAALHALGLVVDETDGPDAIDTVANKLYLTGPLVYVGGTGGMSVSLDANAGAGATATVNSPGNEWSFSVSFTTGTGPAAGRLMTINLSKDRLNVNYSPSIRPLNIRAVQAGFYVQTLTTTSFDLYAANAPAASLSHAFGVVIHERSG